MKAERLKGHLDVLLLAAVATGEASHGYAIARRLREQSQGLLDLGEGTLYPALHRLETAELVASSWATVGGRRRRVYAITPAGRAALSREREEWGAFARAVDAILEAG
jgi:DNA-binding PadR family transcriptional regulator